MKQFLNSKGFVLLILISYTVLSCKSKKNNISTTILSSKSNETHIATISYDYSGCFASGKSEILIYKIDSLTIAKLKNEEKLEVKAKLNSTQLDTLFLFINALKSLGEGGFCTTVSHYSVNYKGETIKRTDNSCQWNGFENLRECLFRNVRYPVTLQ